MKKKIYTCSIFAILIVSPFFAQKSNVFLDRAYWKSNPSIDDIEKNIKLGHDVSELNRFAFDAVSYALIEKVDNATIKHLLSKDGNGVNKLTHDGRTYIFWAAYKDNLELMQYLIDRGAKTDIIDSHGYSVMNFAAATGQTNTELYNFLIAHGANPKTEKNHNGANALLLVAPFTRDYKLVEFFLSKNVDLKSTDNNGNGIFNYAAKGGNIEFLELLVEKGISYKGLNSVGGNAMIFASLGTRGKKNSLEIYQYLEKKGVAANVIGAKGRNPLHAIAGNTEGQAIFKFFMDKGVTINLQDEDGQSPFMNAARSNTLGVVMFLSTSVSDVNAKNKKGHTALTMAIERNTIEVAQFLIKNGADIHVLDSAGNSLMFYLLNTYNSEKPEEFNAKLELLSEQGLLLNKTQGNGKTLYHLAVEKNNIDLLKRVADFNIEVDAKNNDGLTALHLAAMKSKNDNMLKYLISIGADKNLKTDFEESVYDLASENELLQKNNINISFLK